MKFPREFYIPKGSTKVADKNSSAVCYFKRFERADGQIRFQVAAFYGKRSKPDFNYVYADETKAGLAVANHFRNCQEHDKRVVARRKDRNQPHTLKVGTVLYGTWGYDQTNVDCFQVIKVTKGTVTIRRIGLVPMAATGPDAQYVIPDVDGFLEGNRDEIHTKRATGDNRVKLHSSCTLHPWTGGKIYHSWYH